MQVTVAATQMACSWDQDATLARAEALVRRAAKRGANIILLQEMFATHFGSPSISRSRNRRTTVRSCAA